jgi:hypothetical protein
MAEIKNIGKIAEKWTRVTPQRSEDYSIGVQSPKRDWAGAAKAGEANWKAGVAAASASGQFGKGVDAAGSEKWKKKALEKGPGRFSEGVMTAGPDYQKGFAPYAEAIASLTLPPRFPKGDPRNVERVRAISTALRAKKVGK